MRLVKIRRRFAGERLGDVRAALTDELPRFAAAIPEGAEIAIAVGSRGIANLPLVVAATAEFVKGRGARPFVVPAMGSHGGATAAGQAEVLEGYGVTEKAVGVPVRSSMEVVELPRGNSQARLFIDKAAFESDGVILINRIKPHTDFHGPYESGLVKMCVIGLGKHKEALEIHRHGLRGLTELMLPAAEGILASGKILGGIALVENARDETMIVRALKSDEIMTEEPALMEVARENMPSLPVDELDLLIIGRMGKEISGVGIDTNIIGRMYIAGAPEPPAPRIASIVVCDLTTLSHGNALGVGLADVITRRLYDKIDFDAMYANVFTSTFLERAKIPVIAENAREAAGIALKAAHPAQEGPERVVRVRDTLHLEDLYVSQAVLEDLEGRGDIEVMGKPVEIFDENGELTAF